MGGALALAAGAARPVHAATSAPETATLLAPGPASGPAATLADRVARALSRGLVQASAVRVSILGGADGITAANRFATLTSAQDGRVMLLLPGAAAQAQLIGDSRARFEPRHWPAVCGSVMAAALIGRAVPDGASLRVAVSGLGAPEAAALLALELLGRRALPVVLGPGQGAEAAVAQGQADALVLCGPGIAARAAALAAQPLFALDAGLPRDPLLPDVPALSELLPDPGNPTLLEAQRAAAAALRLRGLLVLPVLTPADAVALWRGAARRWIEEERDAAEPGTRRVANGEATALLATLCPAPDVALAYREWLMRRFNWRAA